MLSHLNSHPDMIRRQCLIRAILALFLPTCVVPLAQATSNYQYKSNEFVTITRGLSPDGALSIVAHGDGDMGDENFNLFLVDAKTGKRLGPLAADPANTWGADTLAGAYHANWSADAKSVTISYRSDRRTVSGIKFKIDNQRAVRVSGPTPLTDLQAKEFGWPDLKN